jgi:hypothetical protein
MGKTITYNGDNGLEIMQDLSIEISAIFDSFNDFDKFFGTPYECELFDTWWSEDKWNMHLQKLVYYKQFISEILVKSMFNSKEHFSTFIDINIKKLTSIKNTKLKSVPEDRKIIIFVYNAANTCLSMLLTAIGQTEMNIEDSNKTLEDIEKLIFIDGNNLAIFKYLVEKIIQEDKKIRLYHFEDIYHTMAAATMIVDNKDGYIGYVENTFQKKLRKGFNHTKTTPHNKLRFTNWINQYSR